MKIVGTIFNKSLIIIFTITKKWVKLIGGIHTKPWYCIISAEQWISSPRKLRVAKDNFSAILTVFHKHAIFTAACNFYTIFPQFGKKQYTASIRPTTVQWLARIIVGLKFVLYSISLWPDGTACFEDLSCFQDFLTVLWYFSVFLQCTFLEELSNTNFRSPLMNMWYVLVDMLWKPHNKFTMLKTQKPTSITAQHLSYQLISMLLHATKFRSPTQYCYFTTEYHSHDS